VIPRQETITAGPPFLRDQVKVLFDKCPKMTSLYVHVTNWTWWKFDRSFEGTVEREDPSEGRKEWLNHQYDSDQDERL